MRRTRTGKALALTPRDIAIFQALACYRYLRSTYLHTFAGGVSETRFKERLTDLFHEGFIDRPSQQWQFADARHAPAIHETGERAERILREQGGALASARTFLSAGAHRQFLHSVAICECLASIELAAAKRPNLRFIPWPEILARAPETTKASAVPFRIPLTSSAGAAIPDGVFGLEYRAEGKKAYRFFALEVDRGTMPVSRGSGHQTSYLGKLCVYRDIIAHQLYKTHLGLPNLFVLTITMDRTRLNNIRVKFGEQGGPDARFLFKAVNTNCLSVPASRLLHEPWERTDLSPLAIDA